MNTNEATDPRSEEMTAEQRQILKNARLELCKLVDDPVDTIRPYYKSYQDVMDIIASIEKLLGVQ